ncbi:MAG: membrane protein insertion efficiency factor YidD [Verrucomicrobiales bacterium]|nr:membrane protein insertion efficiency factor YidD [Verrucomicrobiales bacterium]HCU85900.1 membrane protein insertion efficiency factor YidD [Verrucomicrobiales bacterium]
MQLILLALLRFYRWAISPLLTALAGGTICRFDPSCSQYAMEAIQKHGALRGLWLTAKRLGRCHPWGGCGHDPVPAAKHHISVS